MHESESPTTQIEADKQPSIAKAVERLFAGANDAFNRASNCNDAGRQKFHLRTAATYKEWADRIAPLVGMQARIDEQTAMIRRRFNLPRPDRATRVPFGTSQETITASETVQVASDLATEPNPMSTDVDQVGAPGTLEIVAQETADRHEVAAPSTPATHEPPALLIAPETVQVSSALNEHNAV